MRDIAIYKTIHYCKNDNVSLVQYVIDQKECDLYLLDLYAFEVFEYRKFVDGDLLTLQLSQGFLDRLCDAWLAHRMDCESREGETQDNQTE